jgi:hypothetical protein
MVEALKWTGTWVAEQEDSDEEGPQSSQTVGIETLVTVHVPREILEEYGRHICRGAAERKIRAVLATLPHTITLTKDDFR